MIAAVESLAQESSTKALEAKVGQRASICGVVVQASCKPPDDSQLKLETRAGEPGVSIVVPRALRETLGRAFEMRLHYLAVCANGTLSRREKGFLLTVDDESMLRPLEGVTAHVYAADVASPCDANVVLPKLRREVKPSYTVSAMSAHVEGKVYMTAIVEADGRVGDVRVVRSLRQDLDAEAVKALKAWRFEPGTRDGSPAPIVVSVEMFFKLRG